MTTRRRDLLPCGVAVALLIGFLMAAVSDVRAGPPVDLETLRSSYLREAFLLRDYRPGKNSFVEGPDRRWGAYTKPGQRLTLLDVQGTGQLCHIWSTWRPGQGRYRLDLQISHDDPLRVLCNGREVYRGDGSCGFSTRRFTAELQPGRNEFVVQLTNFFNVTFNWAGFALREVPGN